MELRNGITTGTCAAACAYVAYYNLIDEYASDAVELKTPSGDIVSIPIAETYQKEGSSYCFVRKDSGDDPDITNNALIGVCVRTKGPFDGDSDFSGNYYLSEDEGIQLYGGIGVGYATKKGLSCPIGYPAINPVPRKMIFEQIEAVKNDLKVAKDDVKDISNAKIYVSVLIPAGKELALKTFNPNLGIMDGISVLGTSGIVRPMSEDALIETIRLDIRTKTAEGKKELIMVPGNYGEEFLKTYLNKSPDEFVKCSNYVGKTIEMMLEEGVRKVLFTGHIGKLIKVAGGILNTHSKYGDGRMEFMYQMLLKTGYQGKDAEQILDMNTTDQACDFLESIGCLEQTMKVSAECVKHTIESIRWNLDHGQSQTIECSVILFNKKQGLLAIAGDIEIVNA